jgi:hypothetical protein
MDLSSLEGPPLQNESFSFHVISPISPVSRSSTWHQSRRRQRPSREIVSPVSPLGPTSGLFSNFAPASQDFTKLYVEADRTTSTSAPSQIDRLQDNGRWQDHQRSQSALSASRPLEHQTSTRSSRSQSALGSGPTRPSSAGSTPSRPVQLGGTDDRLVWVEDRQLWVLCEPLARREIPQARNNDTFHVAQHPQNPLMQYYDPVAREYETPGSSPPSYESHEFVSMTATQTTPGNGPQNPPPPPPPPHHQESRQPLRQRQRTESGSRERQRQRQRPRPGPPPEQFPERWPRSSENNLSRRSQWANIAERLNNSPLA